MPGKRWGIQYAYSSSSSFGQLLNFFARWLYMGKGSVWNLECVKKKHFSSSRVAGIRKTRSYLWNRKIRRIFFFLFLLHSCYRIMRERFGKRRKTESFLLLLVGNQGVFVVVDFIPWLMEEEEEGETANLSFFFVTTSPPAFPHIPTQEAGWKHFFPFNFFLLFFSGTALMRSSPPAKRRTNKKFKYIFSKLCGKLWGFFVRHQSSGSGWGKHWPNNSATTSDKTKDKAKKLSFSLIKSAKFRCWNGSSVVRKKRPDFAFRKTLFHILVALFG